MWCFTHIVWACRTHIEVCLQICRWYRANSVIWPISWTCLHDYVRHVKYGSWCFRYKFVIDKVVQFTQRMGAAVTMYTLLSTTLAYRFIVAHCLWGCTGNASLRRSWSRMLANQSAASYSMGLLSNQACSFPETPCKTSRQSIFRICQSGRATYGNTTIIKCTLLVSNVSEHGQ